MTALCCFEFAATEAYLGALYRFIRCYLCSSPSVAELEKKFNRGRVTEQTPTIFVGTRILQFALIFYCPRKYALANHDIYYLIMQ